MNEQPNRSQLLALFLQGNIDVIVHADNYKSFLEEVERSAPKLRWNSGRPATKWAPLQKEFLYRISLYVYPSSRSIGAAPLFPEDYDNKFPIAYWGDDE